MRTWIIVGALFIGHCVLLTADKPIDHVNGTVRAFMLALVVIGVFLDVLELLFGKSSS